MAGWLRKLFGGGGEVGGPAGPAPPEAGDNPVHALLDACGVPWRETREDLTRRFGVTVDPLYGWEQLVLPADGVLAEGALAPLSAQVEHCSPRMPPTYLAMTVWHVDDARENVRRVAAALAPWLGETLVEEMYNTIYGQWRFGAASVTLTGWPPDLQDGLGDDIEAHEREPRLATACHIAIETGFRPALTAGERAWLDGFVPIAFLPSHNGRAIDIADTPAPESDLPFVREPPDDVEDFFNRLGRSEDGAALIFCRDQLYIVPVAEIVGFEVIRTLPAKGGGGSQLMATVRLTDEHETSLMIADAPGPDDLNGVGEGVAAATGRPVTIAPYQHDC